MTLDEAYDFFNDIDNSITKILQAGKELLLGHLVLGEKTSNLSGGENVRLKLLQSLFTKEDVLGIDEPFKGLNNEEIYKIAIMLNRLADEGKTIIVVDHETECFKYFSRHIILVNRDGILTERH